ncbi:MAG TPA: exodeoxyribonuclease III [Oculatellaceae cyanobacterium]
MLVASWNVNSVTVRVPHLLTWLQEVSPDVLCVQETKIVDEKFPKETFEALGYNCEFYGEKTYNGVAIISKLPIENVQKGFVEEVTPPAKRFIEASVGRLRVLNAYIPNGQSVGSEKYLYKLRWLESLLTHLRNQHDPLQPTILVGDFNIAPEDRDVYNPEEVGPTIMCSDAERDALCEVRKWGMNDIFREHNEDAGQFSWWDYRMGAFRRNMGFRIDHIYGTESATANSVRCWIDKEPRRLERPSDHAPVIAEFDF